MSYSGSFRGFFDPQHFLEAGIWAAIFEVIRHAPTMWARRQRIISLFKANRRKILSYAIYVTITLPALIAYFFSPLEITSLVTFIMLNFLAMALMIASDYRLFKRQLPVMATQIKHTLRMKHQTYRND